MIFVSIFVYTKPADFDWEIWKKEISQVDDSKFDREHGLTNVLSREEGAAWVNEEDENFGRYMKKKKKKEYSVGDCYFLCSLLYDPISFNIVWIWVHFFLDLF